MKKLVVNLAVVAAVLALAVGPVSAAGHETIVDVAVADGRFTTLVAAVQAAGLVDTLSSGEWTVFAPTDAAFAKLDLNAGNIAEEFPKDVLTDILLYHVLPGNVSSTQAKTLLGDITMANGEIAGLKFFDGSLYVNDYSKIIIPDVTASNGVIHVVDTVVVGPWPRQEGEAAAVGAAPVGGSTIVDVAVSDGRFTTLVAAVQAAGLVETLSGGEWTVFAPTDTAFAKLDLNADNIGSAFSKEELTDILLYHVLSGSVSSTQAKTLLGDITMANGEIAGLKFFDGSLYVNDDSKVIIPDVAASNGLIHAVDTVILGPWPRQEGVAVGIGGTPVGGSTIVDVAVADGRFTTLVAAVQAAGLVETLSGGEWTVFAPTDTAFAKLDLNADNIGSAFSKEELTDVLLYHVLSGRVDSTQAKTLLGDITMANGEIAGLKFFDGSLYVNDDSKVIIPDVPASNGVIHAVDTVILGPWPRQEGEPAAIGGAPVGGSTIVDIAVADGRFTTLVAAVQAAGLVETLSGGEWTVFAPTDTAFAKLDLNADNIGSAFSKEELTDILLYHVLSGSVSSTQAKTLLGDITMANGEIAGLKFFDGSLYVNDDAKVIIEDVLASNGVIHVVDTVILGPWPR